MMAKKSRDPVKDNKEQAAYVLFYIFILFFLLNTIFGLLSASKCLLVSGAFALFGVFIAVVALLRIGRSHPARPGRLYFNPDKLEFIIILGTSAIITLGTSVLFFSIGHMVFFHTIYPPELSAAWIAMITAALSLGLMVLVKDRAMDLPEIDACEIGFILNACFLLSILTMITVVIARIGGPLLDYACAILAAFFLILHGIRFLSSSFKGLMDASCDKDTIAEVEKLMKKIRSDVALKELRVNEAGHILEIIATFAMTGETSMQDAVMATENIKILFEKKFSRPHELFVGIKEQK
ncbi:MAG: hypothetical protein HQL16_05885 [Candidatus Omnitrophica bacterium]|nr:hypothetical protein [Candidatus Omnitrophota bacterium]